MNTSGTFSMELEGKTSHTYSGIVTNITDKLKEQFPEVDFGVIPGINDPEDPQSRTNFAVFMSSLIIGMIWITYITFFNSRAVGRIVTSIANRFVKSGYIKIGSLSWSVLPGKVMFRDVMYITPDFTLRVQDGYLIFRWWRSYVPKDVSEDLSHSDTRVSIQLNGFELHFYNRTSTYKELEKKFGIFTGVFNHNNDNFEEEKLNKDQTNSGSNTESSSNYLLGKNWRDLIPVVKVDVTTGKFSFGNKLLPTTLVISVEEAKCTYSTKPAVCALDHFMHFFKCKADNFKILLASSPKYTGLRDEAPRFMGEGFVVASSNDVDFYYYMDEAGLVQDDMPDWAPVPEWGVDIKCGKGTNFSYGPWADRQRELLYKFFFPPDYQVMQPTKEPIAGEKRLASMFRVRLSTQHVSTLDLLFTKAKETKAVHVDIGQGTNFEVKIPWSVTEQGFQTKLSGTLMMIEAKTSLPFRDLLRCETLQINVDMNYPMKWNEHQEWVFTFTGSKTTLHFIFAHKWYFQDLIDDWAAKNPPDLLYFVPYTWKFQFILKDFELLTLGNEYNWIDTASSTHLENALMGICGVHLNVKFSLPYVEFLPVTVPFVFQIEGEKVDLSLFVPEVCTSHDILKSLDMNAKIVNKDGIVLEKRACMASKWRNMCKHNEGWFDCWTAPKIKLDISFLYHPVPIGGPAPQAEISTPEKENKLLSPLRVPSRISRSATRQSFRNMIDTFDPALLTADKCTVSLRVDSSTAYLYGTLIRMFMHVKENLFGEDQHFTPMDIVTNSSTDVYKSSLKLDPSNHSSEDFDPRLYRPIEVILDLMISDLQVHLIKNCLPDDPPCPFLMVEKLAFEMDKNYRETRLQLQLSPVVLRSGHLEAKNELSQGHLLLTGLQFRGHAMFSELDRPLGTDTLEYAWLIEIQCGSLFGKVTAAQLYNVFVSLETFLFLAVDKENDLRHPRPFKLCQHHENQKECPKHNTVEDCTDICLTVEEMKYKLARFTMDAVDVNIIEKSSALRVQLCPLRFSTCNLHGLQTKQGITALVNTVLIQQYVNSNFPLSRADIEPAHHNDIWIESGCVQFGPVYIEGSQSGHTTSKNLHQAQHDFLVKHDRKTLRLWFLWPKSFVSNRVSSKEALGKCGCVGGCAFFGANANGIGFFKPAKKDIDRRCNVAIPTLNDRIQNPGYGQSILKDNTFTVRDCRIFKSFAVMGEQLLPPKWPTGCHEATKLPFCPDFRTYKSSSSNNSGETPKHPRHHRSFSGKHGKQRDEPIRRLRSVSSTSEQARRPGSGSRTSSRADLVKSEDVQSLRSEASKYTLARTESLISDVLSFYSLDGTDPSKSGPQSPILSSPATTSPPLSMKTDPISIISSPTSTQYETASSMVSGTYETAQDKTLLSGRTSSLSFDTATLQADSPSTLQNDTTQEEDEDDTLSRTLSENSFMSAMSEHDDYGLVNLHMQVNKPITESPLLMTSYISHLSQYRCSYWDETVSILRTESMKANNNLFPKFDMLEEGLSCIKMSTKDDLIPDEEEEANLTPKQTHGFDWDKSISEHTAEDSETSQSTKTQEFTILTDTTSKTTIIVKFKGAIDIVISPVVLESVQRMFESLTPTFQSLHPIGVVNHLHSQSLDRVESKNTLMKKEKSLDLQEKLLETIKEPIKEKHHKKKSEAESEMLRTFEKSVSSFVQASLHLPRINFLCLQASVVEEMCAFSALENVRDITCVSLLALGIQETTFQFCKTSQAKKTVQMYYQKPAAFSSKKKKASKLKIVQNDRLNEPFTFESSETQREELLMTGSLQKAHAQLRRLRNDSSILKDAYITAIPNHKSKVFFKYTNVPKLTSFRSSTPVDDDDLASQSMASNRSEESKLGFNMCECGFEGIAIKVAKRSSNQDEYPQELASGLLDKSAEDEKIDDIVQVENEIKKPPPPKRGEERPDINLAKEASSNENNNANPLEGNHVGGKHSTASGSVELKTSWFNFAAPPKTPISRKIDFTKLDWNLLSTASPSIDAWLNPVDRLQEFASICMSTYHRRVGAVMASLMAESLDVAAENFLKPTRYDKMTSLSKTLRDDPSCQLCSILVKYMLKLELSDVETNLAEKSVPPLTILRQGIVVLSRQWKNALYTPILIEYNLKSKGFKNLYNTNLDTIIEGGAESDTDENEDDDENSMDDDKIDEEAPMLKPSKFRLPAFHPNDGSLISFGHRLSPAHFPPLSEEQLLIYKRPGSIESLESYDPVNSVSDHVTSAAELSKNEEEGEETLYEWMKKQALEKIDDPILDGDEDEIMTIKIQESLNNEGDIINENHPTPQTKQMHLLDAHIIFEPLLSSLGLMPQQIQNLSLKNLGSNVSVLTNVETFKIDIVESEFGKIHRSKRQKTRLSRGGAGGLTVETDTTPAFICEKIYCQIDFKKVTDLGNDKMVPLYMSRAQLKRHTSSLVNFSIEIFFISQKVNMPLLRLLNQIVTMHQNVKETNEELKEKRPVDYKKTSTSSDPGFVTKHKRSSSGSSSTNSESNLSVSRQTETPNYTDTSSRKTIQTPSPSVAFKSNIRTRPKSFAQKFRPNSRLAGYSSGESPVQEPVQDSFILTSAPLERIAEEQTNAIKCWKTMYNLLELYSTMPVTKTVQRQSLTPVTNIDTGILLRPGRGKNILNNMTAMGQHQPNKSPDIEQFLLNDIEQQSQPPNTSQVPRKKIKGVSFAKADTMRYEHTPVIVFGVAKIRSIKLAAMLSGLKLEGEINGLQSSLQYKEKVKAPQRRGVVEASVVGNMQAVNIALLEGHHTIVKIIIGTSQLLYSSQMMKTKDKNSGTMKVDLIQLDIPQHPVDLHTIVTRGTKELSSTLEEFRGGVRILQRGKSVVNPDDTTDGSSFTQPSPKMTKRQDQSEDQVDHNMEQGASPASLKSPNSGEESNLIRPFVMQFHIVLTKLTVSAALLPSLQAEYCMEKVVSRGVTGSKAKFIIDVGKHSLSFTTKLQDIDNLETNLPSEASIDLPNVHISAEYIQDERQGQQSQSDGSILSLGSYLKADAEIGELEHCLTTDLLNHLVFVQKVFMKEVNEVVQKMSGSDRPVPVWTEFGEVQVVSSEKPKPLLFSVAVRLKNFTITATTPANSGVRFETGVSELQISNRVETVKNQSTNQFRISTKARVNMKLSLGQIIRDTVYFEEFQTQAYFKTTIQMSNVIQNLSTASGDKDVIHINLTRPLVFVQPIAVDRAILFWLSYKNAWEYWTEQRLNLNKEVLAATEQVLEKVPISQITSHLSSQQVGTLFLQLNVQDIGLCIPFLSPDVWNLTNAHNKMDFDSSRGAIVATVESSSISACSAGSMVSAGKFTELCIRFADDFNHTLDDWKPMVNDPNLMNFCLVSEGSYEVCSQTAKALKEENAKWFLNIQWKMTGVDAHVDTNIGKHMTALGNTLTTLTGFEQEFDADGTTDQSSTSEDDDSESLLTLDDHPTISNRQFQRQKTLQQVDLDLPFLDDPRIEKNEQAKYLEQEINEQAKVVEDLQKLGASEQTVATEMKKLQVLQAIASKNFRQEIIQKLRRQKSKASYIRDKFGLGPGSTNRDHKLDKIGKSKSVALPSPIKEDPLEDLASRPKLKKIQSGEILHSSFDDQEFELQSRKSYDSMDEKERIQKEIEESPHFPRDKSKYMLSPNKTKQPGFPIPSQQSAVPATEPNVDFEFHVKIFINSGKCVLHTLKEEEKRKMKKDRSFSGNLFTDSPNMSRKLIRPNNPELRASYMSTSRLREKKQFTQDVTEFYIPGLDVRVHYVSKTENEDTLFFDPTASFSKDSTWMTSRNQKKKATLSAWINLQSIPEETIITPTILEFLEQALEPIPTFNIKESNAEQDNAYATNTNEDNFEDSSSGSHAGQAVATTSTSFPVEVIVYFHMQSSTFRFSCVPVSRVECMLRLPSLDLVFSSKSTDCELDESSLNNSENTGAFKFNNSQPRTGWMTEDSSPDQDHSRGSIGDDSIVSGGLSVTGCLNDFSIYVFHPYGAGRKNRPEDMVFSPLSSEERKDSLSVHVAFVKFHLSRSRKLTYEGPVLDRSRLDQSKHNNLGNACVRFSTIINIGSASFKYDMRRLTEILVFPRAWYRKTLVRRLFLGEMKQTTFHPEDHMESVLAMHNKKASITHEAKMLKDKKISTAGLTPKEQEKKNITWIGLAYPSTPDSDFESNKKSPMDEKERFQKEFDESPHFPRDKSKYTDAGLTTAHSWETLVIFALNFKELNVHMNMGNVMGNVDWISRNFKSEGRLSIGSTGHKNMFITLALTSSKLEAKAGIVGGAIDIGRIDTFVHLKEDNGTEPWHQFGLQLDVMEVRFDYMSTSVLMGRISHLLLRINDDWHVTDVKDSKTMKPAQIFVQGELSWDQLQMLISKSTTADLLKIVNKLEEFFAQQFKSSKKLFSTFEPWNPEAAKTSSTIPKEDKSNAQNSHVRHHRHWQNALQKIAGMKIYTLPFKLPDIGSVLGGGFELRGSHISLACFHGINFKSKAWALFSLKDPSISFVSDAQEILEELQNTNLNSNNDVDSNSTTKTKSRNTTVIQTLSFSLGQSEQTTIVHHSYVATVKKISRSISYLPPIKTLADWFSYAFKSSELDEVHRFPTLSSHTTEKEKEIAKSQQKTEEIFAFPCLRMDLKTKHVQGESLPTEYDAKPVVECTFVTDFDNHIYVTTDAEAFFFLHDLISSYLKEKERVLNIQQQSAHHKEKLEQADNKDIMNKNDNENNSEYNKNSSATTSKSLKPPVDPLQNDWRLFECNTWHLEPTVRLISWAGSQIEPYGIDYILQRLGFNHARTTIPKWVQRGCMDPLDKILSMIVLKTIQVVKEERVVEHHPEHNNAKKSGTNRL